MERNYEFRKRLEVVHRPNLRQANTAIEQDEFVIEDGWTILIGTEAQPLVVSVAKDLQDYLFTSMNVSVFVRRTEELQAAAEKAEKV
ncbi:MAG: hypothetical protein GX986_06685, partial [Firmicutes bacterium]|nr:hypothetical protein [Bacillota bacterium]